MKKIKSEKGITLVALIFTILVLVVLAGVAILEIRDSGLVSKAESSTGVYNESEANEVNTFKNYENTIKDASKDSINTTDYTSEEIKNSEVLWAIGTDSYGLGVVAKYDANSKTLTITKNVKDSDGTMNNFSGSSTEAWFNKTEIKSNIKKVVIEEGVTSVSNYAFYKLTALETVQLPETLQSIGHYAFYGCTKLNKINIPSNVSKIGAFIFGNINSEFVIDFGTGFDITSKGISELAFSGRNDTYINVFEKYGSGTETTKEDVEIPNNGGAGNFKYQILTINKKSRSMAKNMTELTWTGWY